MDIYPLGTVVTLKNGQQELMITVRFPLYDNGGSIAYFEYAGCFYPQGQFSDNNFFFNSEDIEKIHFTGYISNEELELQKRIKQEIKNSEYAKLTRKDII